MEKSLPKSLIFEKVSKNRFGIQRVCGILQGKILQMLDVRRQEPWVVVLQSAACRHKNVFDLCSVALCEKQKKKARARLASVRV